MYRKRFYVRINLELHAITCPGVWLCTHGYLEATLKTLGYYFRTGAMEPRFPLLCHDVFTIEGYFKSVATMADLERLLAAEGVELTLWQHGRRLAYFEGKMSDFLKSGAVPKLSCSHNINVQVLLKPTSAFPGILAPKAEMTAEVGVQDRLAEPAPSQGHRHSSSLSSSGGGQRRCPKHCHGPAHFVKPNLTGQRTLANRHRQSESEPERRSRSCCDFLEEPRRQRTVCHARQLERCDNNNNNTNGCCAPDHGRRDSLASSSNFHAGIVGHTNLDRRLSSCSSGMSSSAYTLSQWTRCSSGCSRASDYSVAGTGISRGEHQRDCSICQSYEQTFL